MKRENQKNKEKDKAAWVGLAIGFCIGLLFLALSGLVSGTAKKLKTDDIRVQKNHQKTNDLTNDSGRGSILPDTK